MADSNAPEHTDRGLFGMFGKKDEKAGQHVEQHSHSVDPHATHAPAYTGEGHHAPPPAVSHEPQHYAQGEGGGNKHQEGLTGKLHRSHSSSSSSSSDEDESGGKKEGRKKKGMKEKIKEKLPGQKGEKESKEEPEKKGLMEKIKEKLPGKHEGEKGH